MTSIFDENSEFLKYLKQKEAEPEDTSTPSPTQNTPSPTPDNNPVPKTAVDTTYLLDLKTHQLKDPGPVELVPVKRNLTATSTNPTITPTQNPVSNPKADSKIKKINQLNEKPTATSNLKAFLLDKLKFVFVSGLIFIVTFLAINWSAYSKVFYTTYLDIVGAEGGSPLNIFTQGGVASEDEQTLVAGDLEVVQNTDIPKLDLEIIPPGMRVILPDARVNVPVVGVSENSLISRNWDALERELQDALRNGVVHYPGTPLPNESGNVVLTGHSSYYPWDPGRFKDVFADLHSSEVGDEIVIFYNQQKYTYQVTEIKKVLPTEVNVLGDSGDDRLTLITCTPIGTNLKRLIVIAKPVK